MIIYKILKFLLSLAMPVMSPLFALADITFEWGWVSSLINSLQIVFYIIPFYDLFPLIRLIILLGVIRIFVSLAKLIFDAIPMY